MTAQNPQAATDLLGRDLEPEERKLLDAYAELRRLLDLDLPPVARAGVEEAVSSLWQVVNGLALTDDRPAD